MVLGDSPAQEFWIALLESPLPALEQWSSARFACFAREDIAFLDNAWANRDVNIVTIVAWAGVGKSTLVNHWLSRMAADHYRSERRI
jgi:hypothetical protein